MHKWQTTGIFVSIALFAFACSDSNTDPSLGETQSPLGTLACDPPVPTPDPARSLFVTDTTALAEFSFQKVFDKIVQTGGSASQTSLGLYQQMMDTLNDTANAKTSGPHCDDVKLKGVPVINGFPIQCPRQEGVLAATNPFGTDGNSYEPVALVNRFDLAPQNGSNCGQHRIVFGKISGKTNGGDRMLLIFEATLPNPNPSAGIAACLPVAEFWAGLTSDDDAASRATKLRDFYFTGLPGFPPVIAAPHYGFGNTTNTGQIRANMFMAATGGQQWQLREFRLARATSGTSPRPLVARNTAVQVNPSGTLFADPAATNFRTAFLAQVPALASNDINTIGMSVKAVHNAGESNQQDSSGDYAVQAQNNTVLLDAITAKLKSINRTDLTATNILDRATTQSCAGCHQLSPRDQLGAGLTWPNSNVFTHVSENRVLSPALTGTFLPFRGTVLKNFIDAQCTDAVATVDSTKTIAGGLVGAAN